MKTRAIQFRDMVDACTAAGWTLARVASVAGMYAQHLSRYLNQAKVDEGGAVIARGLCRTPSELALTRARIAIKVGGVDLGGSPADDLTTDQLLALQLLDRPRNDLDVAKSEGWPRRTAATTLHQLFELQLVEPSGGKYARTELGQSVFASLG